jgi:hypothetical protein
MQLCNWILVGCMHRGRFSRAESPTPSMKLCLPGCQNQTQKTKVRKMLSILRKARLKDKEMRILMLCVFPHVVCQWEGSLH